jgi:hypothetical protein
MINVQMIDEDIAQGQPASECNCPVTRALKRITGRACRVYPVRIDKNSCSDLFYLRVDNLVLMAPLLVQDFVRNVDAQYPYAEVIDMKPISFEIPDLDSEVWRLACGRCGGPIEHSKNKALCRNCVRIEDKEDFDLD